MKKKFISCVIATLTISLGISSFLPAVIADSNSDNPDDSKNTKIQEFNDEANLEFGSTTTLCHVQGKSGNSHEIVVSTSSLTGHLQHGDKIGLC